MEETTPSTILTLAVIISPFRISSYSEDSDEELLLMFLGPSPPAINNSMP